MPFGALEIVGCIKNIFTREYKMTRKGKLAPRIACLLGPKEDLEEKYKMVLEVRGCCHHLAGDTI